MEISQARSIPMQTFDAFLDEWDTQYLQLAREIDLFKKDLTKFWTLAQKQYFAKVLYHARGHFHDFLWHMGNTAPSKAIKDVVLKNIGEEFNGSSLSHEQLYENFAASLGVDMKDEYINQPNYLDGIRAFNHGHLKWLAENDAESNFAAFAAYERLDNVDYINLLELVQNLEVNTRGQLFFKIHTRVEHFDTTREIVQEIWNNSQQKIIDAFTFICYHQITMWKYLSAAIFHMERESFNAQDIPADHSSRQSPSVLQ